MKHKKMCKVIFHDLIYKQTDTYCIHVYTQMNYSPSCFPWLSIATRLSVQTEPACHHSGSTIRFPVSSKPQGKCPVAVMSFRIHIQAFQRKVILRFRPHLFMFVTSRCKEMEDKYTMLVADNNPAYVVFFSGAQ